MADSSEKILDVEQTRKRSVSWSCVSMGGYLPAALLQLHTVQGGILSTTHCLRVAGRKPTISMAS